MLSEKLGIKVELLGAALFLTGLTADWTVLVIALLYLYVEDNDWLRKIAVQAILMFLVFGFAIGIINIGISIANNWLSSADNLTTVLYQLRELARLIASGGYLLCALFALKGKMVQGIANREYKSQQRKCNQCGYIIEDDAKFCTRCGSKVE